MPSALIPDLEPVNLLEEDENGLRYFDRVVLAWAGDDRFSESKPNAFQQALLYACFAADRDGLIRLGLAFPLLVESWDRMLPSVQRLKGVTNGIAR